MLRLLFVVPLLVLSMAALARDLPRSDPLRQTLIDTLHADEIAASHQDPYVFSIKYVVRDMFRAGDFAFLCSLRQTPEGLQRTDDSIDVYESVFMFDGAAWLPLGLAGGLAETADKVSCSPMSTGLPAEREDDLKEVYESALNSEIDDTYGKRRIGARLAHIVKVARAHGMLKERGDVLIEHAKEMPGASAVSYARHQCLGDATCLAEQGSAVGALKKFAADRSVSSLVWEGCAVYENSNDLSQIAQCIAQHRTRRECRPGLRGLRDAGEIEQCTSAIEAQCRSAYPDKTEQNHVCQFH